MTLETWIMKQSTFEYIEERVKKDGQISRIGFAQKKMRIVCFHGRLFLGILAEKWNHVSKLWDLLGCVRPWPNHNIWRLRPPNNPERNWNLSFCNLFLTLLPPDPNHILLLWMRTSLIVSVPGWPLNMRLSLTTFWNVHLETISQTFCKAYAGETLEADGIWQTPGYSQDP